MIFLDYEREHLFKCYIRLFAFQHQQVSPASAENHDFSSSAKSYRYNTKRFDHFIETRDSENLLMLSLRGLRICCIFIDEVKDNNCKKGDKFGS